MSKVTVEAGICGFVTTIDAFLEDKHNVRLVIETDCPSLKPMTEELTTVDGMKECFSKIGESMVFQIIRKYCKHAACPVPTAIIKGIEVACNFALPKDVKMNIIK